MDNKIRAKRVKEIKRIFKEGKVGVVYTELTKEQQKIAFERMESHCFTLLDKSRFTFQFEENTLIRMIDHAGNLENLLD